MGEPSKKRSLVATGGTTNNNRIQLLLHCVDGCVPYLNPLQLEQHFPPSENDLWLGLAVRDSCVAPIFHAPPVTTKATGNKNRIRPKKKRSVETPNNNNNNNKVRGYTFAANSPDPWLLSYNRLTVPSFDLRNTEQIGKKGKDLPKVNSHGNTTRNTNNAIHVWTPHGRQKLTAELYSTAALEGLKSHHTVSLFDDVNAEEFSKKRKQRAITRNNEWFQHLSSARNSLLRKETPVNGSNSGSATVLSGLSSSNNSAVWKPILLPHEVETETNLEPEATNPAALSRKGDDNDETKTNTEQSASGVAFVGRWRPGLQLNKLIQNNLNKNTNDQPIQWKAILTTYSLSEILDIATTGTVNVIGTNLPQKWATEKVALAMNLDPGQSMKALKGDPVKTPNRETTEEGETQAAQEEENIPSKEKPLFNADGCIDLSDTRYARDPRPLLPGCSCFVCRDSRFSRAYIHHLVVAKEMVAEILLFAHNLHCTLELLRKFDTDQSNRDEINKFIRSQIPY